MTRLKLSKEEDSFMIRKIRIERNTDTPGSDGKTSSVLRQNRTKFTPQQAQNAAFHIKSGGFHTTNRLRMTRNPSKRLNVELA